MVSFRNLFASALALSTGIALGATLPAQENTLVKRGRASIVKDILKAIGIFTDDTVYTWDFNKFPKYCDLFLETNNGGHCFATIECKEGGKMLYKKDYAAWDNCKVGGMTYFHDPRLGHLGLQFRTRDGYEGEGLTEPLIATFNAPPDKWTSYDVTALALQYQDANRCEAGIAPLNCDNGPFLCRFLGGNQGIQANRKKGWSCGIPVIGNRELADLEMPTL